MTDRYYKVTGEAALNAAFKAIDGINPVMEKAEAWTQEHFGCKPYFIKRGYVGAELAALNTEKRIDGLTVPNSRGWSSVKRKNPLWKEFEALQLECRVDDTEFTDIIDLPQRPGFFIGNGYGYMHKLSKRIFVVIAVIEVDCSAWGKEITNIEFSKLEKELDAKS